MIGEFIDEILSGDRVVFSFVSVWVIAGAIWIVLDWLGNTSRGRFVPKGDQYDGTRAERLEARRRQRAEDDAAVRSTLRDAYGTSSLRVTWTTAHETVAIDADNQLVRPDPRRPSASLREPVRLGTFSESGVEPLLGTFDPDMPFVVEATMPRGRWSVGANPLMLSRSGKPPTAATLRARVWKNHAGDPMWGAANQERMRAGRPPHRHNPLTGKVETAVVDLRTARPGWKGELLDPFTTVPDTADAEADSA